MLTYKATNTKTGQFYIGSARSFGHYLSRQHNHFYRDSKQPFHIDFQADPLSFVWEVLRLDELTTPDYEKELLIQFREDPLLYNVSAQVQGTKGRIEPPKPKPTDGPRWKKETKEKMSESQAENWATNEARKKLVAAKMRETNSKKKPCPHCGALMNAGNLTKHLKGYKCPGKS